jgi:acyl-CoA hydrolase
MPNRVPERQVSESRVVMTEIVLPEDTNHRGSIFGGRVLALIDKCAAVAAIRHARGEVLTISMDTVEFRNPVVAGQILILNGWINAAFGSSMELEVEVRSEDPSSGALDLTTRAFVTMVAVDDNGRPRRVPRLLAKDDEEARRAGEAKQRRKIRLQNATSS